MFYGYRKFKFLRFLWHEKGKRNRKKLEQLLSPTYQQFSFLNLIRKLKGTTSWVNISIYSIKVKEVLSKKYFLSFRYTGLLTGVILFDKKCWYNILMIVFRLGVYKESDAFDTYGYFRCQTTLKNPGTLHHLIRVFDKSLARLKLNFRGSFIVHEMSILDEKEQKLILIIIIISLILLLFFFQRILASIVHHIKLRAQCKQSTP